MLRSVPFGDLLAGSFNQFVGAEDTAAEVAFGARLRLKQASGGCSSSPQRRRWQYLFLTGGSSRFEAARRRIRRAHPPDRTRGSRCRICSPTSAASWTSVATGGTTRRWPMPARWSAMASCSVPRARVSRTGPAGASQLAAQGAAGSRQRHSAVQVVGSVADGACRQGLSRAVRIRVAAVRSRRGAGELRSSALSATRSRPSSKSWGFRCSA